MRSGSLYHNGGLHTGDAGDVLRLLLGSDADTLTVKKNGTMLGVAVTSGLTENLS